MQAIIRKAIFPVAGLGTRFLPATKVSPKEMLTIVDKPLIQYAVEEAIEAGINELIFITGRNKRAIEDHFDSAPELEMELENRNKLSILKSLRNILPANVSYLYIRQPRSLGLGHAVLCARPAVGDEPFAVLLADDLIDVGDGQPSCMSQMVEIYKKFHSSVVAVETVPTHEAQRYGIIESEEIAPRTGKISTIIEKPINAKSNQAVTGRYIFTPKIFELLATTAEGTGGEIQLTDAIAKLLHFEEVLSWQFRGTRYDCGSKLGYVQAVTKYALKHPDIKEEFANYIATLK